MASSDEEWKTEDENEWDDIENYEKTIQVVVEDCDRIVPPYSIDFLQLIEEQEAHERLKTGNIQRQLEGQLEKELENAQTTSELLTSMFVLYCDLERNLATSLSKTITGFWQKRCDHCETYVDKSFLCGRCMEAVYCGKDCQRQAWKVHKHICRSRSASILHV